MPHNDINLLPEKRKHLTHGNPVVVWFNRVGVYLLIIIYAVVLVGFAVRWQQEGMLARTRAGIEAKAEQIRNKAEFIADFEKTKAKFAVLGALTTGYTPKSEYLDLVSSTIPQPVSVSNIDIGDTTITVQATTTQYDAITQWFNKLGSDKRVKSVNLGSVLRSVGGAGETGEIKFSLTINY